MMKKIYQEPTIGVIDLSAVDVLLGSGIVLDGDDLWNEDSFIWLE